MTDKERENIKIAIKQASRGLIGDSVKNIDSDRFYNRVTDLCKELGYTFEQKTSFNVHFNSREALSMLKRNIEQVIHPICSNPHKGYHCPGLICPNAMAYKGKVYDTQGDCPKYIEIKRTLKES